MVRISISIIATTYSLWAAPFQHSFDAADIKHNLNQKLLRAIAQHESGLKQYTIGFVLKDPKIIAIADADLKASPVVYRKSPYKNWYHYAMFFKDAHEAALSVPWLEKATATSTGYDIGLMQVNSKNAHRNGWDIPKLLSDPDYNVDKGAEILGGCRDTFKSNLPKTLECYNKGSRVANFDYLYYASVFSKYLGKSVSPPAAMRRATAKLPSKSVGKVRIAQADDGFVLPKENNSGRTLF